MDPKLFGLLIITLFVVGFTACFTGILLLIYRLARVAKRVDSIEADLEVVKNFLVDRAITSAIIKGIGDVNSPWTLRPDKLEWYLPFKDELQQAYYKLLDQYRSSGKRLDDIALFWELSQRFSRRFAVGLCVPNHIDNGECILGAAYVAKGNIPLEIDFETVPVAS